MLGPSLPPTSGVSRWPASYLSKVSGARRWRRCAPSRSTPPTNTAPTTTAGSIQTGKLADMVVRDGDPLTCAVGAVKDIKVLRTIKRGATVYQAP